MLVRKKTFSEETVIVFHGTNSEEFDEFDCSNGMQWFTKSYEYAKEYGDRIVQCIAHLSKTIDLGDINIDDDIDYGEYVDYNDLPIPDESKQQNSAMYKQMSMYASVLGVSFESLFEMYKEEVCYNYGEASLFTLTRSQEFCELLKDKGYDSAKAIERDRNHARVNTIGIVDEKKVDIIKQSVTM